MARRRRLVDTDAVDLYVLRHAIAADHGLYATDAERPLTEEGIARLHQTIAAWPTLGVEVDLIVSSPYVRARQTAEIAGKALGVDVHIDEALACGARPSEILAAVTQRAQAPGRAMVVGHEPDLGAFVAWLTAGGARGSVCMKKAGLAKVIVSDWREPPYAQLQWLMWPKHMIAIGKATG